MTRARRREFREAFRDAFRAIGHMPPRRGRFATLYARDRRRWRDCSCGLPHYVPVGWLP
jgi:hypothetical protein